MVALPFAECCFGVFPVALLPLGAVPQFSN
jgi:hypothetical protein